MTSTTGTKDKLLMIMLSPFILVLFILVLPWIFILFLKEVRKQLNIHFKKLEKEKIRLEDLINNPNIPNN